MRLLVDMNLGPSWVEHLRAAGIDAIHWSEVGAPDAPDRDLMRWAADHGCTVLTADLDFSAILAATGDDGPSVIQIRADLLTPEALAGSVVAAVSTVRAELAAGAIVTFDGHRMRLRVLPLSR